MRRSRPVSPCDDTALSDREKVPLFRNGVPRLAVSQPRLNRSLRRIAEGHTAAGDLAGGAVGVDGVRRGHADEVLPEQARTQVVACAHPLPFGIKGTGHRQRLLRRGQAGQVGGSAAGGISSSRSA